MMLFKSAVDSLIDLKVYMGLKRFCPQHFAEKRHILSRSILRELGAENDLYIIYYLSFS